MIAKFKKCNLVFINHLRCFIQSVNYIVSILFQLRFNFIILKLFRVKLQLSEKMKNTFFYLLVIYFLFSPTEAIVGGIVLNKVLGFQVSIQTSVSSITCKDETKKHWFIRDEYHSTAVGHSHWCSGAIIADRFILSAAHCFTAKNLTKASNLYSVIVGTNNLNEVEDTNRYCVEKIIKYSNFSEEIWEDDIILLKLTRSLDFSNANVSIIPLYEDFIDADVNLQVAG